MARSCRRTGPALARSTSTWIHWWSSVASANWLIRSWVDRDPVGGAEVAPGRAEQLLGRCEGSRHGRRSTTAARRRERRSLGRRRRPRGNRAGTNGRGRRARCWSRCSPGAAAATTRRLRLQLVEHDEHDEGRDDAHDPRHERRRVLGRGHRHGRRGAAQAARTSKITVVAPATNKSGTGSKTTPGTAAPRPQQKTKSGYPATAVNGFPADAVTYALAHVLDAEARRRRVGHQRGPEPRPDRVDLRHRRRGEGRGGRRASRRSPRARASRDPLDYTSAAQLVVDWVTAHRAALARRHGGQGRREPQRADVPHRHGARPEAGAAEHDGATAIAPPPDCTSTATDVHRRRRGVPRRLRHGDRAHPGRRDRHDQHDLARRPAERASRESAGSRPDRPSARRGDGGRRVREVDDRAAARGARSASRSSTATTCTPTRPRLGWPRAIRWTTPRAARGSIGSTRSWSAHARARRGARVLGAQGLVPAAAGR